jgi:hypothetical protein
MSRRYVPSAAAVRSMHRMSSNAKKSNKYRKDDPLTFKWFAYLCEAMERDQHINGGGRSPIMHPSVRGTRG